MFVGGWGLCGGHRCPTSPPSPTPFAVEGLVTHSNGEIPFANNDTWSFLRAACASLYLGFIFALFAALFGLGQLTGCLPALGTRVIVLYCTILAFVWGLIGTAIAGARISSDLVPSMQEPAYIASGFATITFVWSAAFGCAIAGTVISFVNISLAFYSGATAQAEHAPLQGTLSPAAPTDSAVKAEGAASDAGPAIKMRSLDAAV